MKSMGKSGGSGNASMGVGQFKKQTARPIGKKGSATPPNAAKGNASTGVGQFKR